MCLESTNSTVSDVYVFWLATLAELHDIITDRHNPMPNEVREDIRRIANFRWKGMIEQSPTADVYHAGFILDPRYRKSDILRHANANPLAIAPIRVNSSRQAPVATTNLPDPVRRAGQFLLDRLRIEYNDRKTPICGLREDEAVDLLKDQIGKYYQSEPPFDRPVTGDEGPREWWERLNQDRSYISQPIAQLATYLMGLTPNSMSDERTASYFTWQNSHLRGAQKVSTLVRMAQIKQFKKNQEPDARKIKRPTVKFRDLSSTLRLRQGGDLDLNVPVDGFQSEAGSVNRAEADDSEDEVDSNDDSDRAGGEENFDAWGARRTGQKYDHEPGDRFIAGDLANLQLHALRDLLSDSPLVAPKQTPPRRLQESDYTM
ncbi:hypothetical protein BC835DRAFT_1311118 [Cytidiella melzeri]|nr:hypothetical protein BC835DRAFT_1311118 [Cytidiella melzeri]